MAGPSIDIERLSSCAETMQRARAPSARNIGVLQLNASATAVLARYRQMRSVGDGERHDGARSAPLGLTCSLRSIRRATAYLMFVSCQLALGSGFGGAAPRVVTRGRQQSRTVLPALAAARSARRNVVTDAGTSRRSVRSPSGAPISRRSFTRLSTTSLIQAA
jgi:hypothetical protein